MSLKTTAQEVLGLLDRGDYQIGGKRISIAAEQRTAVADSRLYTPQELEQLRSTEMPAVMTQIEVVSGTSQHIGQALSAEGPVAILNFASARNPGGGFLNGAKAQEEDLCRCSGLYPTILRHDEYYMTNRRQESLLYTDYAIFSPQVPFFKVRGTGDLLPRPFLASVITAPAPNSGPWLRKNPGGDDQLEATFLRRWKNVLCIGRDQQVTILLLGAWGCGAFGGDPQMASQTAKRAIQQYGAGFERIVFAIPDKGKQSRHNLATFEKTFGSAR